MNPARHEQALLSRLENLALKAGEFGHEDHLRVAWYLITTLGVADAVPRFVGAVKKFASHHGAESLYHETITLFFMQTIAYRVKQWPAKDWKTFNQNNGDLLDGKAFLAKHYSSEQLGHPTAKEHFLLPDRIETALTQRGLA